MKTKNIFLVWLGIYILCLLLSFIPAESLALQVVQQIFSVVFFVPGFWLLWQGLQRKDAQCIRHLRLISGLSLSLTTVAFLANLFAIVASDFISTLMRAFLLVVSVPMPISGFWAFSLFLWACIFLSTFLKKR